MAYEICKRCGRMFEKTGITYCKDCYEQNRNDYRTILEHIRKHPGATVMDIIGATSVSLKTINTLVEDGDISYIENKILAEDMYNKLETENKISVKRDKFHSRRR